METLFASLPTLPAIDARFFIPYLLAALAHMAAEPARWFIYTREQTQTRFPLYFHIFSLTALLGYLLPMKMGVPLRIALLHARTTLSIATVLVFLSLDALLYYAPWSILAVVFLAQALVLPQFSAESLSWIPALIVIGLVTVVLLARLASRPMAAPGHREGRVKKLARHCREAMAMVRTGALIVSALVVLANVLTVVVIHWALIRSVGFDLSLTTIFLLTVVSVFAGLATLTPMGLGSYDATLTFLLMQQSLPLEAALSVPILHRFGMLGVTVAVGAWSGSRLGLSPFQRSTRDALRGLVTKLRSEGQ